MADKRAETAEPWASDAWTMDPFTRTAASAFRFWLSFWPVAPLFGVEWRFAEMAGAPGPRTDERSGEPTGAAVEQAVTLGAVPVAKAAEAATAIVEAAVAPVSAPVSAPEAAPEAAPKAAKAPPAAPKPAEPKAAEPKAAEPKATESKAAAPKREPKPEPAKLRADDLTQIKGIGPGLERQLNALGIRSFAQLAGLSEAEMAAIDEKLTSIKGRCFRDDWVGQAKELAN